MKIGLTGNQGFIGKHLANALKENKNTNLTGCDLPKCDLLLGQSLTRFVQGKDIIIHAAAINRGSDTAVIAGSVVATYNLLTALEKARSKAKIVYLSSIQAENNSAYGLSKRLAEIMLENFSKEQKVKVAVLRLTNVFGEGCRPFYNSVVATFCYQVAHGEKIVIKNSDKKINFLYVKDAAKTILKEAFKPQKKLFNIKTIKTNNEIAVGGLAKLIKSFSKIKNSQTLKQKFHKDLYKTYLSYKKSL